MRRLYLQIYVVIVAILVVFAVLAGAAWHHGGFETQEARRSHGRLPHLGVLAVLSLLAVAVGIGAYPVARRLTGRLERLRAGVEGWGAGDLAARMPVEVGLSDDAYQEITSGLTAGDPVIVGPDRVLRALQDGDRVKIEQKSE